jgi:triosephosphate isomerase
MSTASASGRTPLIAGNWKMNLTHLEAIALVQKLALTLTDADYDATDVVVIPPYTSIRSVQTMVDGDRLRLRYGAQDVSPHPNGAHTGDISAAMLSALGCSFVVVGHSERRADHGESDEMVSAKVTAAVAAGIVPILCVGEPLEIRTAGDHVRHTTTQLARSLPQLTDSQARTLVVAYEPVWAIGTGETATPQDAQEVCAALRSTLAESLGGSVADGTRILYGGSVKPDNIASVMAMPDVDGALVGGASLTAPDFAGIIRYERAR